MNQSDQSQDARSIGRPAGASIILLCFFVSGISGLIYQVIWVRELELVFGATTFAASTVLTAFMGGLALGSYYFGRNKASAQRPLRIYGLIEIGIGAYGMAVPFLFAGMAAIYGPLARLLHLSFLALTTIRFVFAVLVLVLPTALMGATLPVLTNFYARSGAISSAGQSARSKWKVGWGVARLYSLNTFGGVCGAAASGFLLIPALGMRATTLVAATMNIGLGMIALITAARLRRAGWTGWANPAELTEPAPEGPGLIGVEPAPTVPLTTRAAAAAKSLKTRLTATGKTDWERTGVLAALGVSGLAALSYEIIWSRVLALIIGSSVYAFSVMLTTFLIGLAIGAMLISRIADRLKRPVLAFALIELLVGASVLAGAYLFNELPYQFISLYRWLQGSTIAILFLARFLVASSVMIIPTILLGALFPLVTRIVHGGAGRPGRAAGDSYAVNTLGAIAGAFATGFIFIPWLGLVGSLRLSIGLNFAAAAWLFLLAQRSDSARAQISTGKAARAPRAKTGTLKTPALLGRIGLAVSAVMIAWVALISPPWNVSVMSSAVYRYAPSVTSMDRRQFFDFFGTGGGQGQTEFYEEGITATVVVMDQHGGRVLKVNGKPEASTAGDLPTQVLIGSLPLLVREKTDNVLVIGLGSGVTLGSVEQFPVKQVTCVELEPAVVHASQYFNDINNRPLEDPRLRLVSNDGRNFIDTSSDRFDVIVSEPSNPWLTGVSNLFTLEYFKMGASRLKDDGVFSQWLQIYEMPPDDVRTLIATFHQAFPRVYLFRGAVGDLMLLGCKQDRKLDIETIARHLNEPKVGRDLERVKVKSPADLVSHFYLGPDELAGYCGGALLNTDDNALIEFSAPRRVGFTEDTTDRNINELLAHTSSPAAYLTGKLPETPILFGAAAERNEHLDFMLEAGLGAIKRNDLGRAEQFVRYSLAGGESARGRGVLGEIMSSLGRDDEALREWQRALDMDPSNVYTLMDVGRHYLVKEDMARAVPYLDRALQADPTSARAHHLRGLVYQASGDNARAAAEYREALADRGYVNSVHNFYLNFGTALISLTLYEEGSRMLQEYVRLEPDDPEGHYQLGAAYEILAERSPNDSFTRPAIDELRIALAAKPNHPMTHYYLSKAYRRLGLDDAAEREFELYERLLPR